MTSPSGLVIVGRIRRAHGIRGEVVVEVMTETPDAIFAPGARVFLGTITGDAGPNPLALHVESSRPFNDQALVVFEEVPDRTAAERLRDRHLLVPHEELEPPAEDEVFLHQLVGLTVRDATVGDVGRVVGTFEVAGKLLLEVARSGGTVLLPYEPAFLRALDLGQGVLEMEFPEGLVEPA